MYNANITRQAAIARLAPFLMVAAPFAAYPIIRNNPYLFHLAILYLLWVVLGQSWNIIGGYAGQVSFGNSIFYGVGAYAAALLMANKGWSMWAGLVAGGIAAVVAAWPFGALTFHLRGAYFVNATFAASEIARLLALNLKNITGGPSGILLPPVYMDRTPFYLLIAFLAAAVTLLIRVLERSKPGLYFQAVRESHDASEALGISTKRLKMLALCMSAFFAGLAGAFYVYYMCYIDPDIMFGLPVNSTMILVVTVGGAGTALGSYGGALIVTAIGELFRNYFGGAHLFAYGAMLILVPMFMPNGVSGAIGKAFRRIVRKGVSALDCIVGRE